jgi:tetratricopeptide (TPR) repeat protein
MEPDNPQIAFNLGLAFSAQKNYEEAAKWFRAVIAKQPADAKAHAYLAICLNAMQKEDESRDELNHALAIDPYYAEVRAELAMDMAKKGNCGRALELIDQAPQMDGRFNQVARFCESGKK